MYERRTTPSSKSSRPALGQHLAWKVIPSGHEDELAEWLDTVVVFDFAETDKGTTVSFTHRGLQPQLECHGVCSTAWDYHLEAGLEGNEFCIQRSDHACESAPRI